MSNEDVDKNSHNDPSHPLFWVDFLDVKPLLEVVNEHDDYFLLRRANFRYTLDLAPAKEQAIIALVSRIEEMMNGHDMIEEDMFYEHGGSELIRWGYHAVLKADNDLMIHIRHRLRPVVTKFRHSNTPLVFLKKIFPGAPADSWLKSSEETNKLVRDLAEKNLIKQLQPTSLYNPDVAWLEAIGYIIRGGNYAMLLSWLNEELRHYRSTGSLRKKEADLEVKDLPIRALFGDRMRLFQVMAKELKLQMSSGRFHSYMAVLLGVTQGAIEKYIRQAAYPFPEIPGGYKSKLRSIENYKAHIEHAENAGLLKDKKNRDFDIFVNELEQLIKNNDRKNPASKSKKTK
jgi:hypothetical protein